MTLPITPDIEGNIAVINKLFVSGVQVGGAAQTEFCSVQSLSQNIGDDNATTVNTFTPITNTDTGTFTPTANGITVSVFGTYQIVATVNFNAGDAVGIRRIDLIQSGIIRLQSATGQQLPAGDTPTPTTLQVIWIAQFNANTNFGVQLFQNSGNIMPTNGIFLTVNKL